LSSGGHNKVKCSVESTRRIDIRLLQKAGVFNHDCYYNCAWTNRGRDSGSMRLQHLKGYDFITALYVLTHNDTGVKENREDRINLAHTLFALNVEKGELYYHFTIAVLNVGYVQGLIITVAR
jgi:hypothetical protein